MPNNVYSILKFHYHEDNGEKIQEIINSIKGESNPIDFNKIIPQPEGIQDKRENILSESEYKWNTENWGTKWNAYDASVLSEGDWKLVIRFTTAWNIPKPIIEKLFEKFPDVSIEFVSADDGGWFAFHINKKPNEAPTIKCWDSKNDMDCSIREAIFGALNYYY